MTDVANPTIQNPSASQPTKTILIVEDDLFLSNLLSTRFQRVGFRVVKAFDGDEALRSLRQYKPDLMLLDIIIPKKSGFEVLEEMKVDPTLKKIPVIIASNLGQDGDVERGKALGAIAYFIKAQISIDDIINRVKMFLETGNLPS